MPKIYLGCSLNNAPQEFREQISEFRQKLKQYFEVLEFFSNPVELNSHQNNIELCQQIYEYDKNCVLSCDLMIAELSHPSLGLGMELAFAAMNNKPIFGIATQSASISRMILGITDTSFQLTRYDKIEETIPLIIAKVEALATQRK